MLSNYKKFKTFSSAFTLICLQFLSKYSRHRTKKATCQTDVV